MKIQFKNNFLAIFESALFRTTAVVIDMTTFILVIDPNYLPNEVNFIRNYVENIRKNKPIYLFFTHSDYDHIIGYGAFPDAKTIVSRAFEENTNKQELLQPILDFDDTHYIQRNYPIVFPKGDIIIEKNNEIININGVELVFYDAKGHNHDGLMLFIPQFKVFIAGDYLSNIEFPYVYYSCESYLKVLGTAKNVLQHNVVNYLISGHGDYTSNKKEMLQRCEESLDYILNIKEYVIKGVIFDTEKLWQKYIFKKSMITFHEENIAIAKREFCKKTTPHEKN